MEWEVWSVESDVWRIKCGVRSLECKVILGSALCKLVVQRSAWKWRVQDL